MDERFMTLTTLEYLKKRISDIEGKLRELGADAGIDLVSSLHDDSSLVHNISMLKSDLSSIGNLDNISIIKPRIESDDVGLGNLVTLKYSDGELENFNILSKDDVVYNNKGTTVISWESPLAKIIFGKKVGDKVLLEIGNAKQEITIVGISPGDFV